MTHTCQTMHDRQMLEQVRTAFPIICHCFSVTDEVKLLLTAAPGSTKQRTDASNTHMHVACAKYSRQKPQKHTSTISKL